MEGEGKEGLVYTARACVNFFLRMSVKVSIHYHIAGNFRGRKLSRIGRKGAFCGENFRRMLKLVA